MRTSLDTTKVSMAIGMLAAPNEFGWHGSRHPILESMRATMDALENERHLPFWTCSDDRVIGQKYGLGLTYADNFCSLRNKTGGFRQDSSVGYTVLTIDHWGGQSHASLAEMEGSYDGIVMDRKLASQRATPELLTEMEGLLNGDFDEKIAGIVVAGGMTGEQLQNVKKSIESALPHLTDNVRIALDDSVVVPAVAAACMAWHRDIRAPDPEYWSKLYQRFDHPADL